MENLVTKELTLGKNNTAVNLTIQYNNYEGPIVVYITNISIPKSELTDYHLAELLFTLPSILCHEIDEIVFAADEQKGA